MNDALHNAARDAVRSCRGAFKILIQRSRHLTETETAHVVSALRLLDQLDVASFGSLKEAGDSE